jgi:pimeloyl-ACP methyl ester carboxylesterase
MEDLIRAADRKPFMAFWAEEPRGDPRWLREITTFLRQEPMAGAGHFFQLEQPEVTNALLRAFIDDIERDPRISR